MKTELGVCYYPEHWDQKIWADDARRMKEIGLSWVRIGEFSWSRLEPCEGQFNWQWLDEAVDILGQAGLKIVMGTPSATPPGWIVKKYPDMLPVDRHGRPRKFGSRRHYCFSHLDYRKEAARIAGQMAQRYGNNPHIQAWQIDNEYDCHDTALSYSASALCGFRNWLARKYQSPKALNKAWGTVFWSMEYDDFDDIDLPNLTVTTPNPAHLLDFRRYASDQVVAFNKDQVRALRRFTDKPLIHNYMGRVTGFDHFTVGDDLEIASWDSYPLGFLEDRSDESDDWKLLFGQQGDPDFQAFHHDLYRAVGQRKAGGPGRFWVMEQQPGPVNWAPWNPIPLSGMVRLWSYEAIAHGAEVVSYFRWRQAPFAQEQMHSGLLRPDSKETQAVDEIKQLSAELHMSGDFTYKNAAIGMVFDYETAWAWESQPQGQDFDYFRLVFSFYRVLRQLGLSVDIIPPDCTNLGAYKLVIIPSLMYLRAEFRSALENFNGLAIFGPRSGSKTENMSIPEKMPPDIPGLDFVISQIASLRPNKKIALENKGHVERWFETIATGKFDRVRERTTTGEPVAVQQGNIIYLGGWLSRRALARFITDIACECEIEICEMPETLRKRQFDGGYILLNYGASDVIWQGNKIAAADVKIFNQTD